jgi:PPOX class probable F420-dependent enzyme
MTPMEVAITQPLRRKHAHAVLATWRRDGCLHMSPVTVGLDAAGRAISSSRETADKVRNLRRDPRAAFCVFREALTGPWVQREGTAKVGTFPEVMGPRIDSYRR